MNPLTENRTTSVPSPLERARVRIKVCGMKYQDNMEEVATLPPDYLGFIFYKKSSRYFNGTIPELPKTIKKVGVFVNSTIEYILEKINRHHLNAVQLHGKESPQFCAELRSILNKDVASNVIKIRNVNSIEIIKMLSIKDEFDFSILEPYENHCDYFLFDTNGKLPGGNGYSFSWNVLKDYPSSKPYFLSGGIGLKSIENIKTFFETEASQYCFAIDINSQFEMEPGLKDIEKLKSFKASLNTIKRT